MDGNGIGMYKTLKELKVAYDSRELSRDNCLIIDNDCASVYACENEDDELQKVFDGGDYLTLLQEALDLLGIPNVILKRFDIYVDPQAKQLQSTVQSIVHQEGGRISGASLTPEGLNIFGWAPEQVIVFFERKAKEFNFRVERICDRPSH